MRRRLRCDLSEAYKTIQMVVFVDPTSHSPLNVLVICCIVPALSLEETGLNQFMYTCLVTQLSGLNTLSLHYVLQQRE